MEECARPSAATPLSRLESRMQIFHNSRLVDNLALCNYYEPQFIRRAMKSSDFQSKHIINKNKTKKTPINPIRTRIELNCNNFRLTTLRGRA